MSVTSATEANLLEHVRPEDRIIDVGASDAEVARSLARVGRERYLALIEGGALKPVRTDAGDLANRFHPISDAPDISRVGADVLILRGSWVRYLWLPSELRGIRIVIVPAHTGEGMMATSFQRLARNLLFLGHVRIAGDRYRMFQIRGHRNRTRTRVYLSPVTGYAGLISRLEAERIRAVVLRWFEDLPTVEPGEDLDLLVADEQVEAVRALISEEPGILPIDLYSVSGLPGSDREGLACYPPALAQRIVKRAVRHPSGAWVPSPDDHLHSLAYHAVYHKGYKSGLPSLTSSRAGEITAEHDYGAVLKGIASEVGVEIPEDIDGLDEYLSTVGWRPPADTLRRLSATNRWIRERYFPEPIVAGDGPEPVVFIVRQRAFEVLAFEEVAGLLDHLGFEILCRRALDPEAADRCRTELRGGNWGQGPYPTSGGPPTHALVALHYGPQPPDRNTQETYPHLTNVEVLYAKEALRDLVNKRIPAERRCNPVHSSDNEEEAWEYVKVAMPDELPQLKSMVEERRVDYRTPLPVVNVLNRGRRAKVELVELDGNLAVRKTFGRGYLRHLEREKSAHEILANSPAVPPLLTSGETWVLRPYYVDRLGYREDDPKLIPLKVLRQMVHILSTVHEAGFALIDAKPDSFLMDRDGLKLVDFEFLYKYPGELPPFHQSYSWHSPPAELDVDRPVGPLSYWNSWMRWTGMPVDVLCYGTPIRQRVFRLRFRLIRTGYTAWHGPGRAASMVWAKGRGFRVRGYARFRTWARSRARGATVN